MVYVTFRSYLEVFIVTSEGGTMECTRINKNHEVEQLLQLPLIIHKRPYSAIPTRMGTYCCWFPLKFHVPTKIPGPIKSCTRQPP